MEKTKSVGNLKDMKSQDKMSRKSSGFISHLSPPATTTETSDYFDQRALPSRKIRKCKSISDAVNTTTKFTKSMDSVLYRSMTGSSFESLLSLNSETSSVASDSVMDLRAGQRKSQITPSSWTFTLLRFPILFAIVWYLLFQLFWYLVLRQFEKISDFFFDNISTKRRKSKDALKKAVTYEEWIKSGKQWESNLPGRDTWKDCLDSPFYDYELIAKINKRLTKIKRALDAGKTMSPEKRDILWKKFRKVLTESGTKFDFGGIYNHRLYTHVYGETKSNIENFVENVSKAIQYYYTHAPTSMEDKTMFLRLSAKHYGRTALCLSGGGGFAFYHIGIIRSLIEQNSLPRIISGTSAGSVMAAFACVHTDDEIMAMDAEYLSRYLIPFSEPLLVRLKRFMMEGNMIHAKEGVKSLRVIFGDMTFLEAYQRTGKILNVSIVSEEAERNPPVLLNYLNTPNILLASALIASCAIPCLITALPLLCKVEYGQESDRKDPTRSSLYSSSRSSHTFKGDLVTEFYEYVDMLNEMNRISGKDYYITVYNSLGQFWRDGSFLSDIPADKLQQIFNVQYTIVSQVNPFINMFLYDRHSMPVFHLNGDGFRGGFLGSFLELMLKLDMRRWIRIIRHMYLLPSPNKIIPFDLSRFLLQTFHGDITVLPPFKVKDYLHAFSNHSAERLAEYMFDGSRMIWPKLSQIRTRMKIERTIDKCMAHCKGTTANL